MAATPLSSHPLLLSLCKSRVGLHHQSASVSFRSQRPSLVLPLRHRQSNQSRSLHELPSLGAHHDQILANGIANLYSADAVEQAWTKYQKMLLDRLNDLTVDTDYENLDVKSISLQTSRNPALANVFNYASMAHNNHFYWRTLSPTRTAVPDDLMTAIERSFSSFDSFRTAFLQTAASMFGPGFVWLVLHYNPASAMHNLDSSSSSYNLRILPTYLAGSPYPGAHSRQQSRDLNTVDFPTFQRGPQQRGFMAQNQLPDSAQRFGGANVSPILCVSTWEHAYTLDWGTDGRRYFLQAWWDHINWERVASHASSSRPPPSDPFIR